MRPGSTAPAPTSARPARTAARPIRLGHDGPEADRLPHGATIPDQPAAARPAPGRFALTRPAPDRFAPTRPTFDQSAPTRPAPGQSLPARPAPGRFTAGASGPARLVRGALLATATLLAGALLAGCSNAPLGQAADQRADAGTGRSAAAEPKPPARPAPSQPFAVGVRTMNTKRDNRPLRVTVWYPARGETGNRPRRGARAATGRFPVVLFSHGLNGAPADYQPLLTRWASAGFVVAAPAYPNTTRGTDTFNILDVVNQPADASQVLTALLALDSTVDDPLQGHLDSARIAAAGHSAGAITTVGLFTHDRDDRLDAGVVLAGNAVGVGTAFAGPAAPLLFVHGEDDPLVSYASGRDVFGKVPWPKAFLGMPGENHADAYLSPDDPSFDVVADTTADFLRWSLYGDAAAKKRLTRDATRGAHATLDNHL